jgi:Single-strand binding protein family
MARTATQDSAPISGSAAITGTQPLAPPATNGTASFSGNGHSPRRTAKANRVEITGLLTKTPEVRYTKGGWSIADIMVSTNEQGNQDVPFVAWQEVAEWAADHFVAGNSVRVIGRVVVRTYIGEDGNERRYLELRADHLFPAEPQPASAESADVDPFAEA